MNALRFRPMRAWCGVCLVVMVTQALAIGRGAGPPEKKQAAKKEDKAEQRIFRLKHISAPEARRVFQELFGARGGVSFGTDERTNSLIVSGPRDRLTQVEAILTKIDVPGPAPLADAPVMKIFRLAQHHIEPDERLESMLKLLIPSDRAGRFVIDTRRKLVIVYADPATQERVQALLSVLESEREAKTVAPSSDLQLRLYWLVDGRGRRAGTELPDNLKELAAELRKLGMASPRLATQLMIATQIGTRFETAAATAVPGAHDITVSVTTIDRKDGVGLSVTISVSQSSRRSSRRAGSLRTQVSVALDRPVLLGVTPGGDVTSAFVVQVTRKRAPGITGFYFDNAPWKDVFKWLAEQTDKKVIRSSSPTGVFTFHGDPKRRYTIGEVVDVLNESLMAGRTQKYLLIHRARNFVVVPADEKLDGNLLPQVTVEELPERGHTEPVSVVVPLHKLQTADVVPEVKKLLGPFGAVVGLNTGNRLVIQDRAGNIRRICDLLREIDQSTKKQ